MGLKIIQRYFVFLPVLFLNFIPYFAFANSYVLFDEQSHANPHYSQILENIRQGATPELVIYNPKDQTKLEFQVKGYLDEGALTVILDIGEDQALLLPKFLGRHLERLHGTGREALSDRLAMYISLHSLGVKVNEVDTLRSVPGECMVARLIKNRENFSTFIQRTLSLAQREDVEGRVEYATRRAALFSFAISTASFRVFGDLREDQIQYGSNTGLVLNDYDENTIPVSYADQATIFDDDVSDHLRNLHQMRGEIMMNTYASKIEIPDYNLKREVIEAIIQERKLRGMITRAEAQKRALLRFRNYCNLLLVRTVLTISKVSVPVY